MIYLYSGTPGSGKSLHMARNIFRYLNQRKDCLVICNFEINLDKIKHPERFIYLSNDKLKSPDLVVEHITDFYKDHKLKENSVMIFLDEAQVLFNARSWNAKGRSDWNVFFSQHRKYGVLCYLVAQFDEMLDKQVRLLVEYQVIHRKVTNFGIFGLLIKLFCFGDVFLGIETWYQIKEITNRDFFKARKKYYSLYDTFSTFGQ